MQASFSDEIRGKKSKCTLGVVKGKIGRAVTYYYHDTKFD